MTAYLIVQQTIRDATKLEEYRTKVAPMLARYEGRFLTRGGRHKLLEGTCHLPDQVRNLEFPIWLR